MERKHVRFLTLLVSLLVLVSLCTTTAFAAELTVTEDPFCYIHGDVNGDGEVGTQDAIYALYYAMWHDVDPDLYPQVNQQFDFTGEGKVSAKDAIYLLYATHELDGYPLKGQLHEHYKPYWTWDTTGATPTATLTIRCGCTDMSGQDEEKKPVILGEADGVEITSVTTEATCVAAGKVEYTAKVTYLGKEYVSEEPFVVDIPVSETGHDFGGAVRDCENGVTCQNPGCDTDPTDDILTPYSLPALGHVLVLDEANSVAATCTSMGRQVYSCSNEGCGYTPYVDLEMLSHQYEYVEDGDHLVDGTTCTYVKTYKCAVGGETIDGTAAEDVYIKHAYTAAMTVEPNCQEKGLKTYTCSVDGCNDSYTEDVAPNGVHHWNGGTTSGNITTYTCEVPGCGETKTSVVPNADGTITKEALDSATELKVGDDNTSVALGNGALSELKAEDTVEISVTKVTDLSGTNLDAGELAQVDGDAVYNFSLKVNGEPQSEFGGEITVTIPYTLQPGDDIDAIDIWYIDDEGNLAPEPMKGVYCNGYVTFKTTHFSYYTVTRLTPAERCARYGHIWVSSDKAATCTEGGYSMSVCQRCGAVDENNKTIIAPLGHDYVNGSNALDATCTEPGRVHKFCQRGDCNHVVMEEIPAMGHDMRKNEERSVANSCYNPGVLVTECANCDLEVAEDLPQLQHSFGDKVETEHPTCNSSGKKHQTCTLCGDKIKVEDLVPLGHDYMVATNGWHWNEDRTSATVDLVCRNNPGHTQTRKAAVTLDEAASKPATCTAGGYLVYTATSSFNKATFTDTITVEQSATGHLTSGAWEKSASQHYRFCDTCGQRADYAEHTWGNVTVTKAPTCKDNGSAAASCLVCGYEATEVIPATGEHDLVNGVCSSCGFTENTCNHMKLRASLVEIDDPNVCPGLVLNIEKCDCGQKGLIMIWESGCEFESQWFEDESGFCDVMKCKDCGLTYEYTELVNFDKDTCTNTYRTRRKVSVGDTVLAEYDDPDETTWKHPSTEVGETINLADYGLCRGELIKNACKCGEVVSYSRSDLCVWSGMGPCPDCGAEMITDGTDYKQGCDVYYDSTTVVTIGGKEVLSFDEKDVMVSHDSRLADYQLMGTSCEDGVFLYYVCADCGEDSYSNFGFHLTAITTTQDLSGYGSCADVFTHAVCCCGAEEIWYEGENQYMELHNWQLVSNAEGTLVETCSDCNYTRTTTGTTGSKDANCMVELDWSVKYTDGKGHEYGASKTSTRAAHVYKTTYELLGGSCEDGVRVWNTCVDCGDGYVTNEYTGHNGHVIAYYDLSQYGMCYGEIEIYACACGKDVWMAQYDHCCQNVEWYDSGFNYSVGRCLDCGTERKHTREVVATIDDCHERVRYTYEYFRDGQTLETISFVTVENVHRFVVTYELYDSELGCEGGYTVHYTCLECGETWDEENCYEHWTRPLAREIVSTNQLCGDLEFVDESCACGVNAWTNENWTDGNCEFQWTGYDNTRQCEIYTCVKCGAIRESAQTWTPVEGEPCKQIVKTSVSFTKNGVAAGSYEFESEGYRHNEKQEFTLLGQTCDDGYTVRSYCLDCGEEMSNDEEVRYGCDYYHLETLYTLNVPGMCGELALHKNGCACGRELSISWGGMCDTMGIGWDEINDCGISQCVNCQMIWYDGTTQEDIPGTCFANQTINWRFEMNGEPIGSFTGTYVVGKHKMLTQYMLYGQTCDEGYMVMQNCVNCGMHDEYESYGHSHELLEYYDLADYGTCGGTYEFYGCACGYNSGWNLAENCDFQWMDYNEATHESKHYCTNCDTYKYQGETGSRNPATCTYEGEHYYRLVRNDQEVLYIGRSFKNTSHNTVLTDLTMLDPAVGCAAGVYATEVCADCGYTNQTSFEDHRNYLLKEIDLSAGCGGALYFYACPCGYEQYFSREMNCQNMTHSYDYEYDTDNVQHNYHTDTCPDCGLVIEVESYSISDDNSCDVTGYDIYTVTFNGQTYNYTIKQVWQSHDTVYTNATLPQGVTNCEDGVLLEWLCRDCGATGTSTNTGWHPLYTAQTIDLAPYGAICGGKLEKVACACGAEARYQFAHDSKCDPGTQSTPEWIPNTIYETQDTSEGYIGTYSYAWLVKCAVTDPEPCGLTIRMAEYWLNENCMAVEYQTWQLGYDEATGTYMDEITIATGRKHAYHPYVATDINDTLADGSTEFGTRWDCPDCGSYAYHKDTHNANGLQTKFECRYVNTMYATNGENRERGDVTEFAYYANGLNYATRNYNEWIHADGYVEWNQHLYSNYDFSNNTCTRTNTWTSSESGNGGVYEKESAHVTAECKYFNDPEPTCSQRGERFHTHDCVVCGNVEIQDHWSVEPTGHNFEYDATKETYVCSVCDLESMNGVMGAIYMEDLTEDTDAVYTVGYWNRDKIQFQPMVSVILDDVADDDNQFVLTGINFNYLTVKDDGVCALTFSKAEAEAAAQQLIGDRNYSGSYAIRISLVPTNGTNELDYAITFDSRNTAQ